MRPRSIRTAVAGTLIAGLALGMGGCATDGGGEVTTLDFFQFKGEALKDFADIIDAFEAENPDIKVVQNQVADSETLIRTLLVKDRTPDVITLNGNGNFGKLAEAGVFYDFSDEPVLETINPGVQDILADLGNYGDEVNSLGYVNNANGIIYNQDLFEAEGLEVPETWDELIALCDTLEERGITPFATSLSENWTAMPSWNGIGAYYAQGGFFDEMRAEGDTVGADSPVSFEKDFPEAMERQAELFQYSQEGYRGASYDDSTSLFANGGAAMMLQGIWALSPVKAVNPDIKAAIFPYPVSEDPEDRMLVSGVDVTVTMARNTPHKEEALRFIEFMFRPDVIEEFAASQTMVPSVEGAELSDDPALQSIAPYFDAGRITGFIDHQVPTAIPLVGVVQQFLYDDDTQGALGTLDNEWRKVAARTITTNEED
ncbi:ABC transporter substrate-binding protein [Microbacterium amylolyticum]|uniref:Raffinose/stachyose/melibiose transport system substrate-binding protein n=1 Tax=Microbacterium amylolyticum TaxID=936337 RepID=A0ABS4ZFL4_9MICO|nr:extracellular solute-binding protein [Microbacterium amylolyticum]MBP2436076.1 raffinose/stachyose/melibiose transport system substrate-binding protein [Microbacterium amylolyticum]